jgi:hypothetical protein
MKKHLIAFTAGILFCSSCPGGKPYANTYEQNIINKDRSVKAENLIFFDGFETGGFRFIVGEYKGPKTGPLWAQAQFQGDHAVSFVDTPARSGKKAVRFEWRKAFLNKTNTSKKAMIHYGKVTSVEGAERWYGFSMYMPEKDFPVEPKYNIVFFQLHATPDKHLKEKYRIPLFSIVHRKGWLCSHHSYDPVKVSPHNDNIKKNNVLIKICPLQKLWNKWTDFVVHVKLSLKGQGLLQVWMDGKLVVDQKNINIGYNDDIGPYPSWGIYSYNGKNKRVLFFDEIYVGNEKADYFKVAPGKFDHTQINLVK